LSPIATPSKKKKKKKKREKYGCPNPLPSNRLLVSKEKKKWADFSGKEGAADHLGVCVPRLIPCSCAEEKKEGGRKRRIHLKKEAGRGHQPTFVSNHDGECAEKKRGERGGKNHFLVRKKRKKSKVSNEKKGKCAFLLPGGGGETGVKQGLPKAVEIAHEKEKGRGESKRFRRRRPKASRGPLKDRILHNSLLTAREGEKKKKSCAPKKEKKRLPITQADNSPLLRAGEEKRPRLPGKKGPRALSENVELHYRRMREEKKNELYTNTI